MSTIGRALAILVIGVGLACRPQPSAAVDAPAPAVVSSIPPVHSLVAAVMAGVGEPKLLVKGGSSPHTASLRPSDAAALQKADLVFWIGDGLETFLAKPLAALPDRAEVVALAGAPGVKLLLHFSTEALLYGWVARTRPEVCSSVNDPPDPARGHWWARGSCCRG